MATASGALGRGPSRDPGFRAAPAIWLATATAVLVFAILTLASSWLRTQRGPSRGDAVPAVGSSADVDVWVGDLAPGVRGVLASEHGDPVVDARYDAEMNRDLGLPSDRPLSYYRLVVFNTTEKPVTLAFKDGGLSITPKGEPALPMRSLAGLLAGEPGRPAPTSPQAATLRSLGASRESVEVPAGRFHSHPIAFDRRVRLSAVDAVALADGTAFHPRRIPGRLWAGLLAAPSSADVKDL